MTPATRRRRATTLIPVCIALLMYAQELRAVPANPDAATLTQPDGTAITLFLKGDEHAHWYEDERGYAVVRRSADRTWVYARQIDTKLAPTSHAVGRVDPQRLGLAKPDTSRLAALADERQADKIAAKTPAPSALTTTRTLLNLVVLVNFADLTIPYAKEQYEALFNEIGYTDDGAQGSVKDFYLQATYGAVTVQSTVVGPVTLDNGYAYYGANDAEGDDVRPGQMVQEALARLEDPNYGFDFDFSTMDGDNNGTIDGLTVIHAGGGEEYGGNDPDYIWSHFSVFGFAHYDGVTMVVYQTEPARRGGDSNPSTWGVTRIGVICHEMGHSLGLPDLYDYGGDSRGAGRFCLMAGGSWNGNDGTSPALPSAWCKTLLGLVVPTVISGPGAYSLDQVVTTPSVYKLQGPFAENEYFLIENRQGAGFDSSLPGSSRGLLVWHVDESRPNNDDQTHYKVDLEEAGGTQHLELNLNSGQDSDYFRAGNVTSFTNMTTPSNLAYNGAPLGMNVTNVSASGPTMSFDVSFPYRLDLGFINEPWGSVQVSPDPPDANQPEYPDGTIVTLTGEPIDDRIFSHWDVYDPNFPGDANHAIVDSNNPTTILMNADRQVTAVFKCSSAGGESLAAPLLALALLAVGRRRR
ncbi:MAG: M6 family metalloprotease domain-containing protein [Phycisphaerae bacterium]|nr:M6 family metalloprotease domain-containing protein [Phycisphaerae bacterium]